MILADDLGERARPHPDGQRRGRLFGRLSFGVEQAPGRAVFCTWHDVTVPAGTANPALSAAAPRPARPRKACDSFSFGRRRFSLGKHWF